MTTRTDIHRAAAVVPADYDFVCYDYTGEIGDWRYLQAQREFRRAHMARTGGNYSTHAHGGSCYICGAHAIYTATFWHRPSNVYIRTGLECAAQMEHGDGESFRRAVHAEQEAQRGIRKAKEILFATYENATANRLWGLYNAPSLVDMRYEERTIRDMVNNLVRYGNITAKAAAYLGTLPAKIDSRAERAVVRAAAQAAALPVPTGKVLVRGTVINTKVVEGYYGNTVKMLVQHADGWKVWGSVPASLGSVERGAHVEFSANVEASPTDAKFGFYKRPTKAKIMEVAA